LLHMAKAGRRLRIDPCLKHRQNYLLRMIPTRPIETLGLQLSGIVCSFCLSIYMFSGTPRDSQGFLGSSCRVLCVLFVCQFTCSQGFPRIPRDSWAPAVGYCVFFLSVNLRVLRDSQGFPGIPGLQLSGIVCSFCLSIFLFSGIPRDS
jgi:hypothetical protein